MNDTGKLEMEAYRTSSGKNPSPTGWLQSEIKLREVELKREWTE